MSCFSQLRRSAAFVVAIVGLGFAAGSAAASDYHCVRYQRVIEYVVKSVPYTEWTVRYDHCGHPVRVATTCYKSVRVPVERVVAILD